MEYSIEQFWAERFSGVKRQASTKDLAGWYDNHQAEEAFVPARLTLREDYGDLSGQVWLIGAPGAVGKSTLAKEICAATGAIYLDLAEATTVAGNYLVGGLVYTDLLGPWMSGQTTVLIDALDEARLRVTQSGFEDFLADVSKVAKMGGNPVVILGRVGIIEEAWLILSENGLDCPVFDIEFFDSKQAKRFVSARLRKLAKERNSSGELAYPNLSSSLVSHKSVYDDAVSEVVDSLGALSQADADRFVGYAPVLDAVAKVIASEPNPGRINDDMRKILEGEVLTSLALEILYRESGKLVTQLRNTIQGVPDGLYTPEEQLERLACQLFSLPTPQPPAILKADQVAPYEQAIKNLLPQHPFLNGSGRAASSSVFEACIIASALQSTVQEISSRAEKFTQSPQHTPNPFLWDFYNAKGTENFSVPTEHIGLIFDSIISKSHVGDIVQLNVEGGEGEVLDVEVSIERLSGKGITYSINSPEGGILRLGRKVVGVSIHADNTIVQLGVGDQLELVGPVVVIAKSIRLSCNQLVVKSESKHHANAVVVLEADELHTDAAISAPMVRSGAQLQVSWPNATAYPWSAYSTSAGTQEQPHVTDALRTLRRLVMAFRSHSKGQLARFRDKIDHSRMLKGEVGEALLAKLISDGIIWVEGAMYCLDANALGSKVGISFQDAQLKRYSDAAKGYVTDLPM